MEALPDGMLQLKGPGFRVFPLLRKVNARMRNNEKKRKLAMTMRVKRMESYQGYRNVRDACS
jgi:hypothetical protein